MSKQSDLRMRILPVAEINQALPRSGLCYEIGSGYGVLAAEIARVDSKRQVVGIDIDTKKIKIAQKQFKLKNLEYINGDVLNFSYKLFKGCVMSDFLHHIPYLQQEILLKKITHKFSPDGVIVIKEIDKGDWWRRWASRLWDFVLYPRDRIYYRTQKEWVELLESLGLRVSVRSTTRWFPGSTWLFICTK